MNGISIIFFIILIRKLLKKIQSVQFQKQKQK
jgi:hypothetical protein